MQTAFAPTEVVCICDAVEEGRPVSAGSFITIEEWLNRFDDPQSRILSPEREGIFVRINPFRPNLYSGSDNDVSAFRHVLVEFDDLPKPEQEQRLRDSGLPITVLIDSGGKSIHGWVRVDAPNRKEWDARRDLIYSAIPGIDAKNKNPSRYSRLPGAWRSPTSQQRLLATSLGAASWEDWLTNRETDDDQSTVVTVKDLINFDPTKDPDNLIGKRWLTRGSSMIISGGTGIGKSSMMMQIVIRWALGKDFFGIAPVRPLRIGIVQAENDKGDLAESFRGVVQGLNMGVSDIGMLQENLHFRTESVRTGDQFLAYARRFITRSKLDVIIGDPLFSYFGGDLSDQGEVSVFLRNKLQPILHQTKVAWIWMHHIGKTQRKDGEPLTTMELAHAGFGSSELANWAREIAVLAEVGQSKPRRFQLAFCKRGSRLPANTLNLQHSPSGIVWEKWNPMMMTGAQLKEEKPYQTRKGRRA
jgi:RecA-family ATPase